MWQRAFVLEYAIEIAAITPPAAAPDEMLDLTRGRVAQTPSDVASCR